MRYDWDWLVIVPYANAFLRGAGWTLLLSLTAIVLGTLFGSIWGVILATRRRAWLETRWLLTFSNDVVRSLPLLVLLLISNYYAPALIGLRSIFWIAVFAMSVNLAAFVADVLRGAIQGVPRPYRDAGLAVGMSEAQVMWRLTLPEAVRTIIPSLTLLYIDMLKMSSLASVIAFPELTHTASQVISLEFRPLEVFAVLALVYMALVLPFSHFQRRLEKSKWFIRRS